VAVSGCGRRRRAANSYHQHVVTRHTAGTRAKDSDRNDTCQILDSALADGQLSMEEHRTRVALATGAETLGDLQSLLSDLQTDNAPVKLPDLNKPAPLRALAPSPGVGWGLRIATAVVLVLLGMGIGWGVYGNTSSPLSFQSDPGATSDGIAPKVLTPPRQLQSINGLNGLFEQMRQKFGASTGYQLDVHTDSAYLERPDPSDNRRKTSYQYRGGWGDPWSSPSTLDSGDHLVDLSTFDAEKVLGILRGAPQSLDTDPKDVKEVWLRIAPSEDASTPELVELAIHVNSDFGGGYIELYPDGSIKSINPSSR
jgi:hypothetical protein